MVSTWWDWPTNFSGGDSVNSTSDLFWKYPTDTLSIAGGNNVSFYPLLLVFAVFFAIFGLTFTFGVGAALAVAGFITAVLSVFLFLNGVLSEVFVIVFGVIAILGMIIGFNKK